MRTGILGGTFDPIHKGHLALARAALSQLKLDRIIFVPTYQHPLEQKSNVIASPEDRCKMIELAIQNEPRLQLSDHEIKRKGISYTVDTLKAFKEIYPKDELFFITGGDWSKNLDQWKEIDVIFKLAHFIVARRPGFDIKNLRKEAQSLDFIPLDVSSTEVRNQIRKGELPTSLISEAVLNYIQKNKLYQT